MPLLLKAYRYRALPTASQVVLFGQYAGARRWTYNWALARRKEHYAATGKSLSVRELCAELTTLKRQPATAWLREVNAQMLQQAIRDLDSAFGAFFARRARFPRFRSKRRHPPSFRFPQSLRLDGHTLLLPKLGPLRLVLHRPLEGRLKSATVKQDASGAWYVTLVVHFELPDTPLPSPEPVRTLGVDLGLGDVPACAPHLARGLLGHDHLVGDRGQARRLDGVEAYVVELGEAWPDASPRRAGSGAPARSRH